MIGIAGPSCSGKTSLAQYLTALLPGRTTILSLDSYYRDLSHLPLAARHRFNFDAPQALDHGLLTRNLEDLAQGRAAEKPVYQFPEHMRAPRGERVESGEYVIVEGLFALYWEKIRALFHTKVFVDASAQVCLARRQDRDVRERGRTPESVLTQYTETVRPMCDRYVRPTRELADLVVSGQEPVESSAAAVLAHVEERSR